MVNYDDKYRLKNVLKFSIPLLIFFPSTSVLASEQDKLAKWNTDVSKTIRQSHADKLAQTTYKEINVKDVRVSDDISKVYPQIESKVTKDGSNTRVVAEAVLNTDKEKVAKDWAKKLKNAAKYGKGVLGGAAVGLMVDQLIDGIDYIMGEGGEVLKKVTPDDPLHPTYQYYYELSSSPVSSFRAKVSGKKFTSIQSACSAIDGSYDALVGKIRFIRYENYGSSASCYYNSSQYPPTYESAYLSLERKTNPYYDSNATKPRSPASENDIKDAIKTKVFDQAPNNQQKKDLSKELIRESYARIWDDQGNSVEIRGDVSNKQSDIVKSDNPTNDGHTTSTPTVTDGKTGTGTTNTDSSTTGTSDGTTYNSDGSISTTTTTTTNTSTSSSTKMEFQLPAFCDWATTVCDWLGWTKEQPSEQQNEDFEIEELNPQAEKVVLNGSNQCPTDSVNFTVMGKTTTLDMPYQPVCDALTFFKPAVLLIGAIVSVFIVSGVRTKEQEE